MSLPLSSQVSNLELSRRIKELGVKQESYFYWDAFSALVVGSWPVSKKKCSAWTVAELGAALPYYFGSTKMADEGWLCFDRSNEVEVGMEANTEADARAKMLIHLIENKIVTVEEVNARMGG